MSETTKILVISDVHGRMRDLRCVLQNETADAMFYLGEATAMWGIRNPPRVWPPLRVCCFSTPTAIITA